MSKYNLVSGQQPVFSGRRLQWLAAALGNPFLRPLLVPGMIRSGGLRRLRSLKLDEPPTHNPLYPAGAEPSVPADFDRIARTESSLARAGHAS
jgi:hypothetical protein